MMMGIQSAIAEDINKNVEVIHTQAFDKFKGFYLYTYFNCG